MKKASQYLVWIAFIAGVSAVMTGRGSIREWLYAPAAWKGSPEFEKAAAELNTPRKVNDYVRDHFTCDLGLIASIQTPEDTFRTGKGVCRHYAAFATYCLKKAGYDVYNLTFWWYSDKGERIGHSVCVQRTIEEGHPVLYAVMNSENAGTITGPYRTDEEICKDLAHGTVIQSMVEDNEHLIERNRQAFQGTARP